MIDFPIFLAKFTAVSSHGDRERWRTWVGKDLNKETKLVVGGFASMLAKTLSQSLGKMAKYWIFI